MLKKIILWSTLAVLAAVLIFGAVNRTLARSGNETAGEGRGNSQGTAQVEDANGARGTDQGTNWQNESDSGSENGRNGTNPAQGNGEPGVGEAQASELVALNGTVAQVDDSTLAIAAEDGSAIELSGRAWRYAQQQGFITQSGDELLMSGFYEDGKGYEIVCLTNLSTGQELVLRDEAGRPMWAGRGRG